VLRYAFHVPAVQLVTDVVHYSLKYAQTRDTFTATLYQMIKQGGSEAIGTRNLSADKSVAKMNVIRAPTHLLKELRPNFAK
jgi:hypothetical protein